MNELQVEKLSGSIVDKYQETALRSSVLKPLMVRSIELDELTAAVTAMAPLLHTGPAIGTRRPQPFLDHPAAECLPMECNAVLLVKLLGRHGRAEVEQLSRTRFKIALRRAESVVQSERRPRFLLTSASAPSLL